MVSIVNKQRRLQNWIEEEPNKFLQIIIFTDHSLSNGFDSFWKGLSTQPATVV